MHAIFVLMMLATFGFAPERQPDYDWSGQVEMRPIRVHPPARWVDGRRPPRRHLLDGRRSAISYEERNLWIRRNQ